MPVVRRWLGAAAWVACVACGGSDDGAIMQAADATGTSAGSSSSTTGPSATATGASGSSSGGGSTQNTTGGDTSTTGDTEADTEAGGATGTMQRCEAPGALLSCDAQTTDPLQAIGLGCPGGPNETIPIQNAIFASNDPAAWKIVGQLGTWVDPNTNAPLWGPREGSRLLLISTGIFDDPDEDGVLVMPAGAHQSGIENDNPNGKSLPAPMDAAMGSNGGAGGAPFVGCDGMGDCSDSLFDQWVSGGEVANDLLWFQLEVPVPGGTYGYGFDFVFFSAEYPDWVGTQYNDIFAVWSDSETYTGNLCFVDGQPCTVTALWPVAYEEDDPELAGTGFDTVGGATGWYRAKGSAQPGETLQLTWAIFDMGDQILDTAVLLDNWRWDCQGCVPSEVDGCGIEPT